MQARRRLYARPAGGRLLGLEPAAAAVAGGEHQLAGLVVGQRAGLARRRAGLPGVLAGDGAKRIADERRLRRVGQADGAAALRRVARFARPMAGFYERPAPVVIGVVVVVVYVAIGAT